MAYKISGLKALHLLLRAFKLEYLKSKDNNVLANRYQSVSAINCFI